MEWIIVVIYAIGIFIVHLIIYKDGEKDIDHSTANIACVAWPVALLIVCLLQVEKWIIDISR